MATAMLGAVASNPLVQQVGKNVVGKVADKASQGILGGIGGAIGGRKGKRIGKSIAKGLSKVRKSIFGFNAGGKVRQQPQMIKAYNNGGVITTPYYVRPLPMVRPRNPRRK